MNRDNIDHRICLKQPLFTIFTPTYNRGNTLPFVYDSLVRQTFRSFEWIIVDDGSTDSTEELVAGWLEKAPFRIRYCYQINQGKHVATNFAINIAVGEFFLVFDSDDRFTDDALNELQKAWFSIPTEDRFRFKGVTCRCMDPETKKILGTALPSSPFDTNSIELRLKFRIKGEMSGFNRTELLKNHLSPVLNKDSRFYPEDIIWFEIAKKYKERCVEIGIRYYYRDQSNSLTGKNINRASANYYLWKYYINEIFEYSRYSPAIFVKAFIGMSRDGMTIKKSMLDMLGEINSNIKRLLFIAFSPAGFLLSKR